MRDKFPLHVLCAVDFSDLSAEAVKLAAVLAKSANARMTCIHARPVDAPVYFTGAAVAELDRQRRDSLVQDHAAVQSFVQRIAGAQDIDVQVGEGEPADVILDIAGETGADLIAVGTRGRSGVGRLWLGSVAEAVVRSARVPVLVVPKAVTDPKSGSVVCAVRNSEISRTVLNRSALLAKALGAELVVVDVLDVGQTGRTERDLCAWASAESGCEVRYVQKTAVLRGGFLEQLGGMGADLIVLGRTEEGSSISDALRHTPAPILLIPKEYAIEAAIPGDIQQAVG